MAKRATPEGILKTEICEYLYRRAKFTKDIQYWLSHSTGLWDPAAKRYRKRNSKHDRRGIPDISGYFKSGRAFFIEVKAGKNKCTPEQEAFLKNALYYNCVAFVARSLVDVLENLKED